MKTLTAETLGGLCLESAGRYGDRPALRLFSEGKICRQISYRMLGQKARQFGLLLAQLGVAPGDRVLLFSENCPEWPVAYFGISLAGAVSVPLLTGFSTYQVENIAAQAEVKAVILNSEMLEKIGALASKLPLVFLDKLEEMTASIKPDAEDGLGQGKGEDLATIIYTSGTSGNSKGVMLSNMNLISNAVSVVPLAKMKVGDRFLSVLPLAHSYECTLGMLAPLVAGSNICYLARPPSPSILLPPAK
ncbi:MAG: long-chain fatty acid--CoA ligase, partial [Treponema sp.]|nr:long-chain fatty acid--CoA ligase [Treponema sp.]